MPSLKITSSLSMSHDPFCAALAQHITRTAGFTCEFVGGGWSSRRAGLKSGAIDIGWVCGGEYVNWGRKSNYEILAAPVLKNARYEDRPVYYSDILVRRASPYNHFLDLEGAKWAYNEPISISGFFLVLDFLNSIGKSINFFGARKESGSHANSFQMVLEGEADFTAVDSIFLDQLRYEIPGISEQFKVVASLGPNPVPPFIISKKVPIQVRKKIRDILMNLQFRPEGRDVLEAGFIVSRFSAVQDRDYDPIREVVQKSPVPEINKL